MQELPAPNTQAIVATDDRHGSPQGVDPFAEILRLNARPSERGAYLGEVGFGWVRAESTVSGAASSRKEWPAA
jgi:hypothetical protein